VGGVGCSKMVMREAGRPQGVVGRREATAWKFGRDERPVPPITAMRTGARGVRGVLGGCWDGREWGVSSYRDMNLGGNPSSGSSEQGYLSYRTCS
jgi:hypothetical protein